MIGRLQTEQDKARLLDGLSSAGGDGRRRRVGRRRSAGSASASSCCAQPGERSAVAVHDPVGDVVPPRPAHPRADRARSWPTARPCLAHRRHRRPHRRKRRRHPQARQAAEPAPARRRRPSAARDETETRAGGAAGGRGRAVRWLDPAAPWAAQVGAVPDGTKLAPALVARVALLYDDDKLDLRDTEEWEAVAVPLGATDRPGRRHRRRPRRPRPAHRGAAGRHLRAQRRTARRGRRWFSRRREGARRPPVPQPHDAGAAQRPS